MTEVLAPEREPEAEQVIRSACAKGAKLDIVGGGACAGLGRPGAAELRLSSAGLAGIVFYAPAEMTLCAKAGTTIDAIEAAIAAHGQILPFEPLRPQALWGASGKPTLGGMVATNLSGPRRLTAGAVRDNVLGLRLVNGLGQAIHCGGRVMKNVTGLDLTKLNCGAHGTLGFLTEATIKLAPRPETETTLVLPGLDDAAAIEAMTRALGSPFGVSGAAWLQPGMGDAAARTLLRLEGFRESVDDRARRLAALLTEFGEARRNRRRRILGAVALGSRRRIRRRTARARRLAGEPRAVARPGVHASASARPPWRMPTTGAAASSGSRRIRPKPPQQTFAGRWSPRTATRH